MILDDFPSDPFEALNSNGTIRLYERYLHDSNQAAEFPPPGSKYDKEIRKVVQVELRWC